MVQTKTTNPKSQAVTAIVQPADMLRRVVQTGKAVHTAALQLVYSAAAYIVLVSHFKSANDDGYQTVSQAIDFMEETLREQTGVKNRMLANYLDPARKIAHALSASKVMFASTLQRLGTAQTADAMIPILSSWLEQNKDRRIESMTQLREALGYSVPKKHKPAEMTAASALTSVESMIDRIEDKGIIGAGRNKLQESALASAIVPRLKSKASFISESIKSVTELNDLDVIERAVKDQRGILKRLSSEAKASVKAAGKPTKGKTTKGKDGGTVLKAKAKPQTAATQHSQA